MCQASCSTQQFSPQKLDVPTQHKTMQWNSNANINHAFSFPSSPGFARLAAEAVSIVISKLPTVIACLPPPIKYFFFLSERKMSKNFVELKKAGLLVWNLIVIICRIFEDGNTAELLTGACLDRWSKEKLGLICVCLKSIMGEPSGPNQMAQKVIQIIEQQKPNWIERQLWKAKRLSAEW